MAGREEAWVHVAVQRETKVHMEVQAEGRVEVAVQNRGPGCRWQYKQRARVHLRGGASRFQLLKAEAILVQLSQDHELEGQSLRGDPSQGQLQQQHAEGIYIGGKAVPALPPRRLTLQEQALLPPSPSASPSPGAVCAVRRRETTVTLSCLMNLMPPSGRGMGWKPEPLHLSSSCGRVHAQRCGPRKAMRSLAMVLGRWQAGSLSLCVRPRN